jgi:hypothetical protein
VAYAQGETYRWAICKEALPLAEMRRAGIPLPAKHVEVVHSGLAWEDFQVAHPPKQPFTGQADALSVPVLWLKQSAEKSLLAGWAHPHL